VVKYRIQCSYTLFSYYISSCIIQEAIRGPGFKIGEWRDQAQADWWYHGGIEDLGLVNRSAGAFF